MRTGRITPSSIVVGKSIIWWAEIGRSHEDGWAAGMTPLWVICTFDFKAGSAAQPTVEQSSAQRSSLSSISLTVKVPISTSTPHGSRGITSTIKCSMRFTPWATSINTRYSPIHQTSLTEQKQYRCKMYSDPHHYSKE
eukprot:Gb_33857 [translate_table: standard]